MGVSAKIVGGMAWLVSGRLGNSVLSLVSTAVLARLLSPRDFGVVAAAWIVMALANVLFDGAFGQNLLRKRAVSDADVRTTLTLGVALGLALMLLVVVTAPWIASFFDFDNLALVLAVSSVMIPCKAVFAIATSQLQRHGRFSVMATTTLAAQFIGNFLVAIPLGLAHAGVWALVAGVVTAGMAEAAMLAARARLPLRPALDRAAIGDVLGSSFFSLANIMNWAANTGANAVVGRIMGESALGLYSRGWKLLDLFVAATATPLSRVTLPTFARLRDDRARLRAAFLDMMWITLPGYAVASVLLTLHAAAVVYVALGPKFTDTVPVAQILFATLVPRCVVKMSESFAVADGRAGSTAVRQGFYAAMMIGGTIVGTRYGIVGVAAAASLAIVSFYLVSMSYTLRLSETRVGALVTVHLRALLLAGVIAAPDYAVQQLLAHEPLLLRHLAAGIVGTVAAAAAVLLAPVFWLNDTNAARLRALTARALGRFRPLSMKEQQYGR